MTVSKQKLDALLNEIRSWESGTLPIPVEVLAAQFDLDIFIVRRILESEGFSMNGDHPETDPNASTLDLDPHEVLEALEAPASPTEYPEEDTGPWIQDPTTRQWKKKIK